MSANTGVYKTKLKNGTPSYRVSITYRTKHISLGSYKDEDIAGKIYDEARQLLDSDETFPEDYNDNMLIPHDKFIILSNFKTNKIYFSTPIFLRKQYFEYYLSSDNILKFDRDDLFFYAGHKIQQRGGYLFVSDYGSQYKILSRYGIKPFAVYGRDYIMVNGDKNDFRYSNIKILSAYIGVQPENTQGKEKYTAIIHINGNYIVGKYNTEVEAAVAYNKAVDTLHASGFRKNYIKNYILTLKKNEYIDLYNQITISSKLYKLTP